MYYIDHVGSNHSPEVTIICKTFNHETYVRQTLDSFVNQQTNFSYEVIIHDDASTDGTTDIIKEYAEKYPNIMTRGYR